MSEDLDEIIIPELNKKKSDSQEKQSPLQLKPIVTVVKPLVKEPLQIDD